MSESIVAKLLRGLVQIEQKHGALKPTTLEMNGDVLLQLGQEVNIPVSNYITNINGRRFLKLTVHCLTVVGLVVLLNDYLDTHTVLVTRKIGPPGDVENEVVGVIDLTPKPEFNAERDTVINVAYRDYASGNDSFVRLVIPREAIKDATFGHGEVRTGISNTWRANYGPYKVTLTLNEEPYAVDYKGEPCILNAYTFYTDPAPAKTEPEVDESWIWLANL